jgi:hypothetical protein
VLKAVVAKAWPEACLCQKQWLLRSGSAARMAMEAAAWLLRSQIRAARSQQVAGLAPFGLSATKRPFNVE